MVGIRTTTLQPTRRLRAAPSILHLIAFGTALLALLVLAAPSAAGAERLSGEALVQALRSGGYNLYFRHAATDWGNDDHVTADGDWTSCDPAKMRQLSDEGRAAARRIGQALRALGVPVGRVLSSEYCRAAETARLLDVGEVRTTRRLMNLRAEEYVGGREAAVANAQALLSEPPPPGTNAVYVAHGNLARAATGAYPGEGGAAIFRPADGAFELVAEVTAEDWQALAERFGKGN